MSEHDELQSLLDGTRPLGVHVSGNAAAPVPTMAQSADRPPTVDMQQWELEPNNTFRATGITQSHLPAGVYRINVDSYGGIHFVQVSVLTDKLIDLRDSASAEIIEGIRTFWRSGDKFKERGILYKRGVLLWGPPGSGKTVTVQMLIQE